MAFREPYRRTPRMLAAAIGLVATLAMAELLARMEGPILCERDVDRLLHPDPDVGWTFLPNVAVTLGDCSGTGWNAPVATNEHGLADQPWPLKPRPGEVRVLLLGNEVVDGLAVAREDRLSVRIAHLADAARGARVSVINAAIPGYTTSENLRWLERRGRLFEPDVVLLAIDPTSESALAAPGGTTKPPDANETSEADLPPASGLLGISGLARRIAGGEHALAPATVDLARTSGGKQGVDLGAMRNRVERIARMSREMGASFAIITTPPCPTGSRQAVVCRELSDIAPCLDLQTRFTSIQNMTDRPLELCLEGRGRWGRDAHFLASHAVWDLLTEAGAWPVGVVRGHRL
jgi:hypothetical protein